MTNKVEIREELEKIHIIVGDLAKNNTNKSVMSPAIVAEAKLPQDEVVYLEELQSMGLVRMVTPKPQGAKFTLWNITTEVIALPNQNNR